MNATEFVILEMLLAANSCYFSALHESLVPTNALTRFDNFVCSCLAKGKQLQGLSQDFSLTGISGVIDVALFDFRTHFNVLKFFA